MAAPEAAGEIAKMERVSDTPRPTTPAVKTAPNVNPTLHYLLLDKRDPVITDRLKTFTSFSIKTEKFGNSFIPYCLNHFD